MGGAGYGCGVSTITTGELDAAVASVARNESIIWGFLVTRD
jgi:hypothetical protein